VPPGVAIFLATVKAIAKMAFFHNPDENPMYPKLFAQRSVEPFLAA
jgi:hypothetical protein